MERARQADEDEGVLRTGDIPLGCDLCIQGRKAQVNITFLCNKSCPLCPVPGEKRDKDFLEFKGKRFSESDFEAFLSEMSKSLPPDTAGVAISGGEPFLVFERVMRTIEFFKTRFGKNFHVHLYTNGTKITDEKIQKLADAGLDELRVDSLNIHVFEKLAQAPFSVVCEVPCIPTERHYDVICRLIDRMNELRLKRLNLNELEVTEENADAIRKLGVTIGENIVPESREMARRIITYAGKYPGFNVFFCSYEIADRIRIARNRIQDQR
ncbi:MAG: radical SAM protein [Patescibacteria group bacterium]